jgi:ATP-dependent DNA helicase RecG
MRASPPLTADSPVGVLAGAGPVTASRLAERGLHRVRDLLYFFPTAYEDYRRVFSLADLAGLPEGTPVVVRGKVVRVHRFFRRLLDVYVEEAGATLRARWFRPNAGMAKAYEKGKQVALAGKLRRNDKGEAELIHPSNVTVLLDEVGSIGIRARYPRIEGVPGRTVEKIVAAALLAVGTRVEDWLPGEVRARRTLPEVAAAFASLHQPPPSLGEDDVAALCSGTSPAHRRFAFEDLFVLQTGLALERRRMAIRRAPSASVDRQGVLGALASALPFALTAAQARAVDAVFSSMESGEPMQCLLQGDVGSGKTAVAFAASLHAARGGGQTLLMAPTVVLAEQHFQTLVPWSARAGLRCGLFHSGLDAAAHRAVLEAASAGELDLIVGTHALLDDELRLSRLALAIVDEQHRFGVRQRARLRRVCAGEQNTWKIAAQNGMVPHLLVLSATPIPRSLALTLYGDLDLVTLDALPPGRKPVVSEVCVGAHARKQAYATVKAALAAGGRALVVCPAIAEQDDQAEGDGARASVLALSRELRGMLAPARVGVLHGQLSAERQRAALGAFRAHALDVLISTTVVEVGVDLPGANDMVVEDAERFGLAQLHQLRGRVGRGREQARCFFLTSSTNPGVVDRLHMLAGTTDGFRIAEEDLRRRGSGDLQGIRQSGVPELRFADFSTYLDLVESARSEAQAVLASDPELERPQHAALRRAVTARFETQRPIAEEAG